MSTNSSLPYRRESAPCSNDFVRPSGPPRQRPPIGSVFGIPAFYNRERPLVSYGAGKSHCAFYVQSPAVMDAHREALEGYDTAKGTVRFQADQPLPAALVEKLVRARMEETDTAG